MAADSFISWVSDPARTNSELFTVELFLEQMRVSHTWPFDHVDRSWEAKFARAHARKLNPAYRPSFHYDELCALQERASQLTHFHCHATNDRPISDLSALRFFPALTDVDCSGSDVADLSPLASLPALRALAIHEFADLYGHQLLDFSQCGPMSHLETLRLSLKHPWPHLAALANWPALKDVTCSGNILALADVVALPTTEIASFSNWVSGSTASRDLRHLPAMPRVKRLKVNSTASLEGIERYPTLLNLEIGDEFTDLTPLTQLPKVTSLILNGDFFKDLSPLARMPVLRELHLVRERAIDLSPLADAPQLRRVTMDRCTMMRTELASLNAGLLPESIDFLAETPRPLGPLKFFRIGKDNTAGKDFFKARDQSWDEARHEFYEGDKAFAEAENRAFRTEVQTQLDALLGRGWGLTNTGTYIHLRRFIDTTRTREVIQLLREYSARSRFPWHFTLRVEPHGDMSDDLEEMRKRDRAEKEPDGDWLAPYYEPQSILEENEEDRKQRQERYEVIQREHLLQLRGEEGVDPDLLYSTTEEPPTDNLETEENPEDLLPPSVVDDDDQDGGVAIAPPPPAPPDTGALSEELEFFLDVYEDCITASELWAEKARYNLGEAPIEWTPEAMP